MQKRPIVYALCLLMLCACLSGCAARKRTTMLNTVDTFFSDQALLEATARELKIDGDEASVRIHVMNISGDAIDGFSMQIHFLDESGNVLYTDTQSAAYEVPMENYESASITANCSGKDVGKIVAVSVNNE